MICERGNSFGYNDLIVDTTSITRLKKSCEKSLVALDCTHSLQQPNGIGKTGGNSQFIEDMVKYGAVMGADALFIETHPYPHLSPSDSENMLELSKMEEILIKARKIYDAG
jgi:2-dehydro-3-deoxyphosphooctonate aldolase (KDO 8-P synthase)